MLVASVLATRPVLAGVSGSTFHFNNLVNIALLPVVQINKWRFWFSFSTLPLLLRWLVVGAKRNSKISTSTMNSATKTCAGSAIYDWRVPWRTHCQCCLVAPPVALQQSRSGRHATVLISSLTWAHDRVPLNQVHTVEPLLYDHPHNHIGVVV